jgi:DNA-directed RNA polymerase subunit RPC12/RpoP
MSEVLSQKIRKARKEYRCNACEWIVNGDIMNDPSYFEVTFADKRILVKLRQERFKILKGTKYLDYNIKNGGEIYNVKARIDANDICMKYELYSD